MPKGVSPLQNHPAYLVSCMRIPPCGARVDAIYSLKYTPIRMSLYTLRHAVNTNIRHR